MFQDEQAYLDKRLSFCRDYEVDCVYTMFEETHAQRIYGTQTRASSIVSHIPGYVSDELRAIGRRLSVPDRQRPIDIGYRGRRPPLDWGSAAQEKYEIAIEVMRRARGSGLALDIETDEDKRIYGRDWYRFIADCRATLGTESGTDVPFEGELVPYRTISPRHLEAGALGSCQILYEGNYSGLLEPNKHYIPLRKDFSNFEEVIAQYHDASYRTELVGNVQRDLIADERASYKRFVGRFDQTLEAAGLSPRALRGSIPIELALRSPRPGRRSRIWLSKLTQGRLRAATHRVVRARRP